MSETNDRPKINHDRLGIEPPHGTDKPGYLFNDHHPHLYLYEVNTYDFEKNEGIKVFCLAESEEGAILQSTRYKNCSIPTTAVEKAALEGKPPTAKLVEHFQIRGWGKDNFNGQGFIDGGGAIVPLEQD